MKKITRILTLIALTGYFSLIQISLLAQPGGVPDDPSVGGTNGAVGHPVGAGAALTSGMYLLIFLGGTYGIYKIYQLRKKKTAAATDMKA